MVKQQPQVNEFDVFRHSNRVAYRQVGGEVLLVPVRTDPKQPSGVYTLNRTASFLWLQIDGNKDVRGLAAAMETQFEVSIEQAMLDTTQLISDLLSFMAVETVS
ncbi:MAG: PqqD family protein [Deltaproteobacteria bacterium]|nr:PqqD family protein [Deltaproteobacteria bacterium]MBN2674240.1 PqqD family protein [Deltaproteobacteria bacterium]